MLLWFTSQQRGLDGRAINEISAQVCFMVGSVHPQPHPVITSSVLKEIIGLDKLNILQNPHPHWFHYQWNEDYC